MAGLPKVCVIGAGTSGVICSKVLSERGLAFDTYEKGSGIGGIWRFANDNGMSTCYRSLHINTSKRMMELSDFSFRPETAEYPTHTEILAEFERYVDRFGFRDRIRFGTEVVRCERERDGTWAVEIDGPQGREVRRYDFLVVANGHHWCPRMVDFPGRFSGIQFHSHHYVDVTEPYDLRDKRVVVVGMGNSAMDIACELGRVGQGATKLFLSQRSGVWVMPKIFGSVPQDRFVRHPMRPPSLWEHFYRRCIPARLRTFLFDLLIENIIRITVGHPSRVGLKAPREHFHMRHPTISQEIHNRLVHGDIVPKGNIAELMGDAVRFEDGSVEQVDAIIYATGYNISFPFFDPALIRAPDNDIPLWHRIFEPRFDNLAFIALVQPVCAMMPIAELQSVFVAEYLTGRYHLPPRAEMEAEMLAYDRHMKAGYTQSRSHTIQIDCPEYSYNLQRELRAGSGRAKRAGNTLPVPGRTATELPTAA